MSNGNFEVKIIDYGLARILDYGTYDTYTCGTIEVIAPEALGNKSDHRVDVWGIGLISYMMFTSTNMFDSKEKMLDGKWCLTNLDLSIEFLRFICETVRLDSDKRSFPDQLIQHPWF